MDLIKSKKLSKSSTDLNQTCVSATKSKYIDAIKGILFEEYSTPSSESVRYFIKRLSSTTQPELTVDQLRPIVKEAFDTFVDDRVNDQLKVQKPVDEEKVAKTSQNLINCHGKVIEHDSFIKDEDFEKFFVVDIT